MTAESVRIMQHQEEGIAFLVDRKAGLLAFEQGLGKTLVAIRAFAQLRTAGLVDALFVICPNSLKRNWVAEIRRFEPLLAADIIEGQAQIRRRAFTLTTAPIVIVSYETARTELSGVLALLSRRRTALVLDESHAVKNRYSLTSIAAQHFAPRCPYRWLLSGTPITNSVADIYAQISIVTNAKPLGSFDSFIASFGQGGAQARALRDRIAPYVFRKTKADCLDLPEKTFVDLRIELPSWQRTLYDQMRDQLICEVRSMSGEEFRAFAPSALARLLRLSQLASNPALLLPTEPGVPAKFKELDFLLDEIIGDSEDKVIVWSHYVRTLETLLERYAAFNPVALHGSTPASERQDIARAFQSDRSVRLLIANPAAAGTGFNLTAARYAIYETVSWRYDFYSQSQDRIHRIGQSRPVTYLRLIAADTIEEVMVEALARKSQLARALLGDYEDGQSSVQLSSQQFCEMLASNRLPDGA